MCEQKGCDGGAAVDASWAERFEAVWPVVEQRLRRVLRARQVPLADHDDLLQEVATRALAAQVQFHCSADLLPWASTVLRRVHGRHLHKLEQQQLARRRSGVRRVPDAASAAIAHIDLELVARTMASWSPIDRAALLGATDVSADADGAADAGANEPASGATYVRRHRLRAKLLRTIDGLGVVLGRFRRFHLSHGVESHEFASACLSPVAVACAALVLPLVIDSSPRPPAPTAPSAVTEFASASLATVAAAGSTIATSAGADTSPRAASTAASSAASASPRKDRGPRPLDSPVTPDVEAAAADHRAGVEVTNNEERKPFLCLWGRGVVPDGCYDPPLPGVVIPTPG